MLDEKLDVAIELEEEGAPCPGGGVVRGSVELQVDEDCSCESLSIRLDWRASSKDVGPDLGSEAASTARSDLSEEIRSYDDARLRSELASEVEWSAGDRETYEFELDIPPGPYTYDGEIVEVEWLLRVDADVPWNVDTSAERVVEVLPGDADEHLYTDLGTAVRTADLEDHDAPEAMKRHLAEEGRGMPFRLIRSFEKGIKTLGALALAAVVAAPLTYKGVGIALDELAGAAAASTNRLVLAGIFVGAGIVALGFAGWSIYSLYRSWFAERVLGDVGLEVEPESVHRGDTVRARLEMSPERDVTIEEISFAVEAAERISRESASHAAEETEATETVSRTVYRASRECESATDRSVQRLETVAFEEAFEIPDDAPFSLFAGDVRLPWSVHARLRTTSGEQWEDRRVFVVRSDPSAPRHSGRTSTQQRASGASW